MQTEALQILYIQKTYLIGTESFTNCSEKKTYKTIFGPLKAYLAVGVEDGRFDCSAYKLDLHV